MCERVIRPELLEVALPAAQRSSGDGNLQAESKVVGPSHSPGLSSVMSQPVLAAAHPATPPTVHDTQRVGPHSPLMLSMASPPVGAELVLQGHTSEIILTCAFCQGLYRV